MKNNIITRSSIKTFAEIGVLMLVAVLAFAPLVSSAASLSRQLSIGMTGSDVSDLQRFLAQDNTIYPQGLVTGYFGSLTASAVSNFQARNGLETNGSVGAATLLAINAQMPAGVVVSGSLGRQLELGMTGSDVSTLQSFLAQDATIYPQGLITGFFGPLTKSAVSNFQARNGISTVGRVGPITLALINSRLGGVIVNTGADVYAPSISAININRSGNTVAISWNTSESAKGVVYYSTSPLTTYENLHSVDISGSTALTDNLLRSSQNVVIGGLASNTTYYYVIYVTDAFGNVTMTLPATFQSI